MATITNPDISATIGITTTATNLNLSDNNNTLSSPTSRRGTRAISSPWTQIVRGESEPIAAVPLSPSSVSQSAAVIELAAAAVAEDESAEYGSGNAGKRPAWNKPSNGAVEVGPVMGAHSWPALSETTRGSSTKSSSESLKGLADGSSPSSVSQGTGAANPPPQKQASNNGNPNSTPNQNHTAPPTRQRSMKRNGVNTSSNGSLPQPPATQGPAVEMPLNSPSPRDHTQKSGFVSQSHSGNDHPQQRTSFRNRNGGSHPRGDGSHHHNFGGRRDQDRGNQDWNSHRNFNGRDAHMQPQRAMQRFIRHPPPPPPPSSTAFIPPPAPAVRPYGSPIGFPELASPVYYVAAPPPDTLRGVPFVAAPIPPHAVFFPAVDPQLQTRIVTQIDYYFSNENLIKDTYLRQNMDEQGWVPIKLIAGFNKVSLLTDNIKFILDAVRSSNIVEVQGDKLRKRNDWMRWIMPTTFSNVSSPQSQGKSSPDMLSPHLQSISLEHMTTNNNSVSRSSSGDWSNQSQLSNSMGGGGSDRSNSARNTN